MILTGNSVHGGPYQPMFDLISKIGVIKQDLLSQTYDGPYLEPVIVIDRDKVENHFKEMQLLLKSCVQSMTFSNPSDKKTILGLLKDIEHGQLQSVQSV